MNSFGTSTEDSVVEVPVVPRRQSRSNFHEPVSDVSWRSPPREAKLKLYEQNVKEEDYYNILGVSKTANQSHLSFNLVPRPELFPPSFIRYASTYLIVLTHSCLNCVLSVYACSVLLILIVCVLVRCSDRVEIR